MSTFGANDLNERISRHVDRIVADSRHTSENQPDTYGSEGGDTFSVRCGERANARQGSRRRSTRESRIVDQVRCAPSHPQGRARLRQSVRRQADVGFAPLRPPATCRRNSVAHRCMHHAARSGPSTRSPKREALHLHQVEALETESVRIARRAVYLAPRHPLSGTRPPHPWLPLRPCGPSQCPAHPPGRRTARLSR